MRFRSQVQAGLTNHSGIKTSSRGDTPFSQFHFESLSGRLLKMGFGILILLLVMISLVRLFLYIRSKSFANCLPVIEPCHPIIGNAMLVTGTSSVQLFNNIARALANPAKLFRVMATVMPVVVTNDPDMTQRILTSPDCLEKAFLYNFFRLDSGLFAANCASI